jgi:hypothetical protein
MSVQFKIVFSGELKEGTDQTEFVENFSRYFKSSNDQALALLNAKREVVIKKGLNAEKGAKYLAALEKLGMVVRMEPMEQDGLSLVPMDNQGSAEGSGEASENRKSTCPKCGSERLAEGECLDCGIIVAKYLESGMAAFSPPPPPRGGTAAASPAPVADADPYRVTERTREVEPEQRGPSGQDGPLVPESVPAGNGWIWIADGFDLFRRSFLSWIGAFVISILLLFGIILIPFLGSLAVSLFSPVITGGFMIGCREQELGEDFKVSHLFSGFQQNFSQLLLVGLLYLGATIVIGIIAALALGGAFMTMGGTDSAEAFNPTAILLPMLVIFALFIPVLMAYWFAPALVALEGVTAIEAMKLSFVACLRNILPFLLYGVIVTVLSFVAAIPFMLGFLVLSPVIIASIYTAYRDIFSR